GGPRLGSGPPRAHRPRADRARRVPRAPSPSGARPATHDPGDAEGTRRGPEEPRDAPAAPPEIAPRLRQRATPAAAGASGPRPVRSGRSPGPEALGPAPRRLQIARAVLAARLDLAPLVPLVPGGDQDPGRVDGEGCAPGPVVRRLAFAGHEGARLADGAVV